MIDLAAAQQMFDEGRWRAALQLLDAGNAAGSKDPRVLALWADCKASLGDRSVIGRVLGTLLELPGTTPKQAATTFTRLVEPDQLSWGPRLLAWADARKLEGEEREEALRYLPPELWPAERVFAAVNASSDTHNYDRYLNVAKARFPGDARLARAKERPPDYAELRRRQQEEAKRRQSARLHRLDAADEALEAHDAVREAWRKDETGRRFEAAVLAAREDVAAHRVFADWLQQKGDVRGELMSVQAMRVERPDDEALKAGEQDALAKVRPAVLGRLGELEGTRLEFRLGLCHALRVAPDPQAEDYDALGAFLELDERRVVRELALGALGDLGELDFAPVIERLVDAAPSLAALESLFIGDFDSEECELSWSDLGDATPLYAAFPKLKALKLRAGRMSLGRITLPELRRFAIETGGLGEETLKAVIAAKWPKLESLSLWFGMEDYGCDCGVDDVAPLLERKDLALKHLGLCNASFTDELVRLLLRSPLLPKLESLDLSLGCLTVDGARELAENKARFAHLRLLDVSENCLDDDGLALVKDLCATVKADQQSPERADGAHRYAAVGE